MNVNGYKPLNVNDTSRKCESIYSRMRNMFKCIQIYFLNVNLVVECE